MRSSTLAGSFAAFAAATEAPTAPHASPRAVIDRPRLRHFYDPWSRWDFEGGGDPRWDFEGGGDPPPGTTALCGYVRRPADCDGVWADIDSVDACVVCRDLRLGDEL